MSRSNGSFITSNLAIASNVVGTDRILIVYNAIANTSIGAGSPQTRTIQVTNLVYSISNDISLMAWTNSVIFTTNNVNYNASIRDCYIFVDTNDQGNCTITLPSISANGKGYVIKKTNANTADTITIITDNANTCLIENSNSYTMNSMANFVKDNEGNFWLIGNI
jgi:hypothetical protein